MSHSKSLSQTGCSQQTLKSSFRVPINGTCLPLFIIASVNLNCYSQPPQVLQCKSSSLRSLSCIGSFPQSHHATSLSRKVQREHSPSWAIPDSRASTDTKLFKTGQPKSKRIQKQRSSALLWVTCQILTRSRAFQFLTWEISKQNNLPFAFRNTY